MNDRRLAPNTIAARVSGEPCGPDPQARLVVCMTAICSHPKARCSRCRAADCVHSLDAGVCAPCQVRDRSSGRDETVAGNVIAHVFGGGVVEFIETIGEAPGKRSSRGQWRGSR